MKMSPPWWEYYRELFAMFGRDADIKMNFDDELMVIKMWVDNQAKADALAKELPATKDFGNVKLKIEIIPSDKAASTAQLYKTIFNGNPVFSDAVEIDVEGLPHCTYVMFKPEVVQFYNDNLCDAHGNITTLYQDIAKDIFGETTGLYYCTDKIKGE